MQALAGGNDTLILNPNRKKYGHTGNSEKAYLNKREVVIDEQRTLPE